MAEPNDLPTKPPITSLPVDHVCSGGYNSDNNNFHFRGIVDIEIIYYY